MRRSSDRVQLGWVLLGIVLTVAWLGFWGLGLLAEYSDHASLWYPPAALTFAALTVVGWRMAPFLLVASIASTFWQIRLYDLEFGTLSALGAGLAFATAHVLTYGLAAVLLQWLARKARGRLPLIIIDYLLIAVLGSLLASVVGVQTLAATGLLAPATVGDTWMPFWVGDMVALIVLGPFFSAVLLRYSRYRTLFIERPEGAGPIVGQSGARFSVKLLVNVLFIAATMLLTAAIDSLESVFMIFFLVIPQMWLTYSETPYRTAASIALNSVAIVVGLYLLRLEAYAFVYQFAIAMVATTAYVGIALPVLVSDNARLRQRVMRDALTGAASRDYLEAQVTMEIDRCARNGSSLCLLVIDVDRFKRVNDRFGHAVGDRVLARVFEAARTALRRSDVLARFGGDEFVALLADTEIDVAEQIAERLRAAVATLEFDDLRSITISVGVAGLEPGDDFTALFSRADQGLYRAKRSGRNAVSRADGKEP